jgi:hypothetical protein
MTSQPNRRIMPPEFVQHAQSVTVENLCRMFTVNKCVIQRWIKETGVVRDRKSPMRALSPAPAGFIENCATMHRKMLCDHYNTDLKVISRWILESGAVPVAFKRVPAPKKASRATNSTANLGLMGRRREAMQFTPLRSIYDDARDFLATDQRCPVYRCDDGNGRPNQNGTHWRMGSVVMRPADLLERAKLHGFGKPFGLAA